MASKTPHIGDYSDGSVEGPQARDEAPPTTPQARDEAPPTTSISASDTISNETTQETEVDLTVGLELNQNQSTRDTVTGMSSSTGCETHCNDDTLRTLRDQETELASSLKQGKREDLERDANILKKMADVYTKRGLLTKYTTNCVYASALYNAALLRTKDVHFKQEIEKSIRQNETSFGIIVGKSFTNLPSYFREDAKHELLHIRNEISPEATKLLDGFIRDLHFDSPEEERIQTEEAFVKNVRALFGNVCSNITSFTQFLFSKCKELLGPPPQEFASMGMGSLARGETTPYSDLEWAILVADESELKTGYFRKLVHLFHLFVLNLGETNLRTINILSLNDRETPGGDWFVDNVAPRGFEFDSAAPFACKTPLGRPEREGRAGIELIRTPEHMARICEYETALKEGYNFARILTSVVKLDGSDQADQLVDEFKSSRRQYKDEEKVKKKALEEIDELVEEFYPKLAFHEVGKTKTVHNIKEAMFRLPTIVISLFKTLFALNSENTWDILDEMAENSILTNKGALNLQVAVSIVTLLRLDMYCSKEQQNELISILLENTDRRSANNVAHMGKVTPLIFRYYYTMLPFIEHLQVTRGTGTLEFPSASNLFYEPNDYNSGRIFLNMWSLEEARDKFLSHVKKTWNKAETKGKAHCKILIPHSKQEVLYDPKDTCTIDCLEHVLLIYLCQGNFREALQLATQLLKYAKLQYKGYNFNPLRSSSRGDHPQVAQCFFNVGMTYHHMGEHELALKNFLSSLKMRKRLHSDWDHPVILRCLTEIGKTYQLMGKVDLALEYHLDTLEMTKRLHSHDEDHPDTASKLNSVGDIYRAMGKFDLALQYQTDSLNMTKRLHSDVNHPEIASVLMNIGETYEKMSKLELALQHQFHSLEMRKSLHSESYHPDIASSLKNIGSTYCLMGRLDMALEYQLDSLNMERRIYGDKDHPNIASSLNNIRCTYHMMGKLDLALQSQRDALEMQRRLYRVEDHPEIASSLRHIGDTYREMGKADLALQHDLESLAMWKRLHNDEDHLDIASSLTSTAGAYQEMGMLDLALQYQLDSLNMLKRLHTDGDHPDIAIISNNIGTTYQSMGKPDLALEHQMRSLEINRRLHGDIDHPLILNELLNIGRTYQEMGVLDLALEKHRESIKMSKRLNGDSAHPVTALSLCGIGLTYLWLGQPAEALVYLADANEMNMKLYDAGHPGIVFSLLITGEAHRKTNETEKALHDLSSALDKAEHMFGDKDHLHKALLLSALSNTYSKIGSNPDKALQCSLQSLEMYQKLFNNSDLIYVSECLKNVAISYLQNGDSGSALKYSNESLDMVKRLDCNHPIRVDIFTDIAAMYCSMGESDRGLEVYLNAVTLMKKFSLDRGREDLQDVLRRVSKIYTGLGNSELASEYLEEAGEIDIRSKGDMD